MVSRLTRVHPLSHHQSQNQSRHDGPVDDGHFLGRGQPARQRQEHGDDEERSQQEHKADGAVEVGAKKGFEHLREIRPGKATGIWDPTS